MKNSIFTRLKAKKEDKVQKTLVQRELNFRLHEKTKHLDDDAQAIIGDLMHRIGVNTLTKMTSPADLEIIDAVCFSNDDRAVIFGTVEAAKREEIEIDFDKLKLEQFATYTESDMYTFGTRSLLELLIRYSGATTATAKIIAVPHSAAYDGEGKAIIKPDHLLKDAGLYDNTRTVGVTILFDTGFVTFLFEEKVQGGRRG